MVRVVEVVVVIDKPNGQPLDDEGGKVGAASSPLLLGVFLYQCLVDVLSHEREGLLFKVLRLSSVQLFYYFLSLLVDDVSCLVGCGDVPHSGEGVHVER